MRQRGRQRHTSWGRRRLLGRRGLLLAAATLIALGASVGVAVAKLEFSRAPEIQLVGGIPVPAHPKPGEELVCGSGSWNGSPEFTYQWIREGGIKVSDSVTPGTYVLQKADENHEIWCEVTAKQGSESMTVESANSVCIGLCGGGGKPPEVTSKSPPVISGTPEVGKTLTCSQGEWNGEPVSYVYQWLRDKEVAIPGGASSAYTVKEEDATHKLTCRVTAKNAYSSEATAESTGVLIKGEAPRNIGRPKVQGTPKVGQTLTCNEGSWSGSKPITFRIEWLRNGTVPTGVSGATYLVQQSDEGQRLSCSVTAENLDGSATETSEQVSIAGEPIKATAIPRIEGTPAVGETLVCTEGAWNQPPTHLTYAWVRENPSTKAKESTGGATSKYQVAEKDLGEILSCTVTAENVRHEHGSATSEGLLIPAGSGPPPSLLTPPTVTPSANIKVGTMLTCNEGEWANASNFAFQWLREGVAIPTASAQRYIVEAADQGHQLACVVTAENSEGVTKAKSVGVSVSGEVPSDVKQPEVQGPKPPRVGEALTCVHGEWKGAPAPTFQYEWLRLPEGKLVGTSQSYTVTPEDRGHPLTCNVTAGNPLGSAEAKAKEPVYVPGSAPVPPLGGPTIEHEAAVGKTVVCNPNTSPTETWGGAPAPTFTYAWLVNGTMLAGQTSPTFTVGSGDRGATLQCKVTGSNSEGSASSTSKGVHIAGVPPESLESPYVTGTGKVGLTLTCQRGVWNGKPPPSFSYQWYRDGVPISGAVESTYQIVVADQGHLITCTVTGANLEGRTEAESSNGIVVPGTGHGEGGREGYKEGAPVIPSAGVILASLRRQLTTALEKAHLKSVAAHGFSFSFNPPTRGTFEVMWYQRYKVKGAHGSTHTKYRLLAQAGKSAYASVTKGVVRIKLTAAGKAALRGRRHASIVVKAVFTVPGKAPVTWTATVVLS